MNDDILVKHMEEDAAFQEETRRIHLEQSVFKAETEGSLADIHTKIDGLATKEDIRQLMEFMKSFNIGIGIFKFSWDNAAKIGSFVILIAGLFFFFKAGIVAFFSWVLTNNPGR